MSDPRASTRFEHRFVSVNDVRLHVVDAGPIDGDAVLLLHGFPDFWWGWHRVIAPLVASGRRVIAPDMRGYGRSDAPEGKEFYTLDALVADVVGLMDALGFAGFTIVGHDWGGVVAWAVAAQQPNRVDKLVALAAPHPASLRAAMWNDPRQILRSLYIGLFQLPILPEMALSANGFALLRRSLAGSSRAGTFSPKDLERYVASWREHGRIGAMLDYYRALRSGLSPVGRVAVPTQILWGAHDRFLGERLGRLSLDHCDDGRFTLLRDATHWIPHEWPTRVVEAILSNGGERRVSRLST